MSQPNAATAKLPPSMMEAVTINGYGPYNEVFVRHGGVPCGAACGFVEEKQELLPVPTLGDDAKSSKQVIIENYCTSINPVDLKLRAGYLSMFVRPTTWSTGVILGQESSGRVVAVGKDVTRFRVGDEVMGMNDGKLDQYGRGTYAEYSLFSEEELAHKPSAMPHYVATTLPTSALATYQALVEEAKMKLPSTEGKPQDEQKKRVLILGASGGVGTFAVEFAKKMLNAEVYAVCSQENAAYVKFLGADYVVTYDKKKEGEETNDENAFEDEIPDVDVVMDLVGRDDWRKRVWRLLKKRKDTEYIFLAAANKEFGFWDFASLGMLVTMRRCLKWMGMGPGFHVLTVKPDGKELEQLAEWHIEQNFKTCIFRCFEGLQNIPGAHKLLDNREMHHRGKTIVSLVQTLGLPTTTQTFIHQYREDTLQQNK